MLFVAVKLRKPFKLETSEEQKATRHIFTRIEIIQKTLNFVFQAISRQIRDDRFLTMRIGP